MTRRRRRPTPRSEAAKSSGAPRPSRLGATLDRAPDWVILVVFCGVFSLLALSSVAQKSGTFDEPSNLASGYLELTQGNYWLKFETLPLVKALAAAPLLLMRIEVPAVDWKQRWKVIDRFVFELNGGDALLMVARVAIVPLALGLGCLVFLWTRRLFGKRAALFALFLYCFEPNIIAHSALVTTDLGVACFLFLTVYGLFRLTERASVGPLLAIALGFSLAVATKFSMAALIAIVVLLGVITSLSSQTIPLGSGDGTARAIVSRRGKLIGLGLVLAVTGVVAWGVIWAAYRFSYSSAESQGLGIDWGQFADPGSLVGRALAWLRAARLLPEPYVFNFFHHIRISPSWPGYLWGEVRPGGWWYYFVVTLLLKTPVPLLLLIGVALTVRAKVWRDAALANTFLVLPAVVYFIFISSSGFNMGHRHILAVLPFLMVLAGALIPWAAGQGVWVRRGLIVLSLWYVTSSLSVFPHYLAYFNELAGGPGNGYKYLVDSNLDWGQDLKALKRYMDQQGIERVWLSYFGAGNPDYYGIRYDRLPGYTSTEGAPIRRELAVERLPRLRGTVAISATNLQGVYLSMEGVSPEYFTAYRETPPVAKIGYSIFVYRFE